MLSMVLLSGIASPTVSCRQPSSTIPTPSMPAGSSTAYAACRSFRTGNACPQASNRPDRSHDAYPAIVLSRSATSTFLPTALGGNSTLEVDARTGETVLLFELKPESENRILVRTEAGHQAKALLYGPENQAIPCLEFAGKQAVAL